jgi:hypothetical protein
MGELAKRGCAVELNGRSGKLDLSRVPVQHLEFLPMFVSAILAAGGRGTAGCRGAAMPKQLLIVGNRTILQRSFSGGDRRQDSVANVFLCVSDRADVSSFTMQLDRLRLRDCFTRDGCRELAAGEEFCPLPGSLKLAQNPLKSSFCCLIYGLASGGVVALTRAICDFC